MPTSTPFLPRPCRSAHTSPTFDAGLLLLVERQRGRTGADGSVVAHPTGAVSQQAVAVVQHLARVGAHSAQAEPALVAVAVAAALLRVCGQREGFRGAEKEEWSGVRREDESQKGSKGPKERERERERERVRG